MLPLGQFANNPNASNSDSHNFVGIARLAAAGEQLREGHQVEYRTLEAKSLLNRVSANARVPFQWTINPYRGCEFGCKYCYARYTHEFMELRDPNAFEKSIYVKQATVGLSQELRRVKPGEAIAIGTATDPYQPAEKYYEITRKILEELALPVVHGFDIGIITKSNLVTRDIDLLQRIGEHNRLHVSLTITTLDVELARKLEPRAPRPDLRMEAVRRLREAGITAGVSCAPVLPGINDDPRDLERLVKAAAQAGAQYVWANSLFLKDCSAAVFMPWLEQHYPHLVPGYRRRYGERAFLPRAIAERTQLLVRHLETKHGIRRPRNEPVGGQTDLGKRPAQREEWLVPLPPPQMELFAAS